MKKLQSRVSTLGSSTFLQTAIYPHSCTCSHPHKDASLPPDPGSHRNIARQSKPRKEQPRPSSPHGVSPEDDTQQPQRLGEQSLAHKDRASCKKHGLPISPTDLEAVSQGRMSQSEEAKEPHFSNVGHYVQDLRVVGAFSRPRLGHVSAGEGKQPYCTPGWERGHPTTVSIP